MKGEDDATSVGVDLGVRQVDESGSKDVGHGGFADPAQGQAGQGDAKLHGVDELVELLMQLLDGARADAVRRNQLLQPGFAHADQGELGGHKERVGRDQQDHRHDAQHHEGNHEAEILPFECGVSDGGPGRMCRWAQ